MFIIAHYALQKLHILPSTFANMSMEEQAFIIASIQVRIDNEKSEIEKLKRSKNKK